MTITTGMMPAALGGGAKVSDDEALKAPTAGPFAKQSGDHAHHDPKNPDAYPCAATAPV
jgi:hypothetical protein